jgi:hypothetical protein
MVTEINTVSSKNCNHIINFYAKYGDQSYDWYKKKLKKDILYGRVIGKICQIKGKNEVLGSYLGRIQSLLCDPSLKAIQSIDTLIAPPLRGGIVLRSLANEFYKDLKEKSFVFIYGLPNKKIDKFRYRVLKWYPIKNIYSYTVLVPIFLLRWIYKVLKFIIKKKLILNFSKKQINFLKGFLILPKSSKEFYYNGVYWVLSENFYFSYIGLCRAGRNMSKLEKFFLLLVIANSASGFFLKTYATENSETAKIFNSFSLLKKNLDFSGLILSKKNYYSLSEKSFEFVEFDTFGLL